MAIKNFRVGGLVVVVVVVDDSVAVNIRKSLNYFTPFESSKLGGNSIILSSLPFRKFILSALFVLDKMYEISTLLLSLLFFSPYENQ